MVSDSGRQDIVRSELILGGQKSGKSRRAEWLARQWLDRSPTHRAALIATGQPLDEEMQARIARHRVDRAERVPGLATIEEPLRLAKAIRSHGGKETLLVVDCLTLWLTQLLMPVLEGNAIEKRPSTGESKEEIASLLVAISEAPGPLVLVGNEIGLGVIPLGHEVRAFVDALGRLNQQVAQACARVTLMVAGLPMTVKDGA